MFFRCGDEQDIKNLYRKLSKHLHPDVGGDACLFSLLQDARDYALTKLTDKAKKNEKRESTREKFYSKSTDEFCKVTEDVDDKQIICTIIYRIKKYANVHKRFDASYVDSILEFFEGNGYVTASQFNTMVKIYYSFRMDNLFKGKKSN